jgi:hypothetical protein
LVSARHTPPVHSAPRSQAVPLQHACPAAPHAAGWRHRPLAQARPALQVAPGQHRASTAPQGAHDPPAHTLPAEHTSPAQQRWPLPPQLSARSHTPSAHTAPPQHSLAFLHTPPTSTQQRPALQPKLEQQSS